MTLAGENDTREVTLPKVTRKHFIAIVYAHRGHSRGKYTKNLTTNTFHRWTLVKVIRNYTFA